jgi:hypothetical protein
MKHGSVPKRPAGVVGLAVLLMAASAAAQAGAAAPAATAAQDYSLGFKAFVRMGVPDTAKAEYVGLTRYGGGGFSPGLFAFHEIKLSGNAWLLAENKDGKNVFVTSEGQRREVYDRKTFTAKKRVGAKDFEEMGQWKSADLARDLAKASEFLDKKIKAKESGDRSARYDSFSRSDEGPGTLFLFAVFAWQNGRVQEANELAGKLFALAGDSRKVIVAALNVFADGQLDAANEAFRKDRDWKAYRETVAGLLKSYTAGWRKAGAVRMLAERLEARAGMAQPPPVSGEGLGEEDQKLAAALALEPPEEGRDALNAAWLFPRSKSARDEAPADAVGRIRARGLKSVPLLLALAADETLCPVHRDELGGGRIYYSSSSDSRESPEELARKLYDQMDRPMTRGEIACALLRTLCAEDEEGRRGDEAPLPEETAAAARKVYDAVKTLPPEALAGHFLKNGSQGQKESAINYLAESDADAHAEAIEAFLLEPPAENNRHFFGGGSDNALVHLYVEKRGEKAAAFVEKYAEARKKVEPPSGLGDNEQYVKEMAKQAEREIATLRAMVKKADLAEVVAAMVASEEGGDDFGAVFTALRRVSAAQALPALLSAAVQTTNAAARARVLQTLPMLSLAGGAGEMEAAMENAATPEAMEEAIKKIAEKNKQSVGTNAASWKVLLADTRAAPERNAFFAGFDDYTVKIGDLAAQAVESLYGGDPMAGFSGGREHRENLRAELQMEILRARAAARLEGKDEGQLPGWPSADDVGAERRKAIDASVVKAADAAALAAALDALNDAETLYLAEAAEANPAVQKALAPLSRRIVSVAADPVLAPEDAARLAAFKGAALSTNLVAAMREVCARQVSLGKPVSVGLSSGGLGRGLALNVKPLDEMAQRQFSGFALGGEKKPQGLVTGLLRGGGGDYTHCMWPVELPAAAAPVGAAAADEEEDDDLPGSFAEMFEGEQERFGQAAAEFCASEKALGRETTVLFVGALPSKEK